MVESAYSVEVAVVVSVAKLSGAERVSWPVSSLLLRGEDASRLYSPTSSHRAHEHEFGRLKLARGGSYRPCLFVVGRAVEHLRIERPCFREPEPVVCKAERRPRLSKVKVHSAQSAVDVGRRRAWVRMDEHDEGGGEEARIGARGRGGAEGAASLQEYSSMCWELCR